MIEIIGPLLGLHFRGKQSKLVTKLLTKNQPPRKNPIPGRPKKKEIKIMFTVRDINTGDNVEFEDLGDVVLDASKDYVSGEITKYVLEINGVRHDVSKETYNKIAEDKGL